MKTKSLDDWFIEDVLRHEALLMSYLRKNTLSKEDINDLRQETYARIYDAAQKHRPKSVKAFMLTTARNIIIDRARKAKVVSLDSLFELDKGVELHDDLSLERELNTQREVAAVKMAIESLPTACKNVVIMRKINNCSQKETAQTLGISESTVETQISKGIRKLAIMLYDTFNLINTTEKNEQDVRVVNKVRKK